MTIITPTVGIIGAGRVGSALAIALRSHGYRITAVASRTMESARRLADKVGSEAGCSAGEVVVRSDLTLLTVPDDSIMSACAELAAQGNLTGHGLVHTSGVAELSVLEAARLKGAWVGGLHPMLPIMSPEPPTVLLGHAETPTITFGVEAGGEPLRGWLAGIVHALNGVPIWLRPGQDRARYHAAGTIASNYNVTLFAEAVRLLQSVDPTLDERIIRQTLVHLVGNTLQNLEAAGAVRALTGPIARGDAGTVEKHLTALQELDPELAALYRALGNRTIRLAAERGLEPDKLNRLRELLEARQGHYENHNS